MRPIIPIALCQLGPDQQFIARVSALAIVRGSKLYSFPHDKYGKLEHASIRRFADDVASKRFKPVLRSESPSAQVRRHDRQYPELGDRLRFVCAQSGPGSGDVDRVVATSAQEFLGQIDIDRVLAVRTTPTLGA